MPEDVKESQRAFRPGDVVVVSQDFHSTFFRGRVGVVDGPAIQGATGQTLYRLKIDVPPHHALIPDQYLQLKSEADQTPKAPAPAEPKGEKPKSNGATAAQAKGSFLSRLFSKGK